MIGTSGANVHTPKTCGRSIMSTCFPVRKALWSRNRLARRLLCALLCTLAFLSTIFMQRARRVDASRENARDSRSASMFHVHHEVRRLLLGAVDTRAERDAGLTHRANANLRAHTRKNCVGERVIQNASTSRTRSGGAERRLGPEVRFLATVDDLEKLMWSHASLQKDVLSGKRPFRALLYTCARRMFCGGFTDRLEGMIVAYYLALASNRAFFIEYDKPGPLEKYYTSAMVDWRLESLPSQQRELLLKTARHSTKRRQDADCSRLAHFTLVQKASPVVRLTTNHGYSCFWYLFGGRSKKLNASFAKAFNWLFKRTAFFENTLARATSLWVPDKTVCMHIRRGGYMSEKAGDCASIHRHARVDAIRHQNLTHFWECAKIAQERFQTGKPKNSSFNWMVFVDNDYILDEAGRNLPRQQNCPPRVVDTRFFGPIVHIDKLGKYDGIYDNKTILQGQLRAFADHALMMRCRLFVASHSSFSMSAAALAGKGVKVLLVDWKHRPGDRTPVCKEIDPFLFGG